MIKVKCINNKDAYRLKVGRIYNAEDLPERFRIDGLDYYKHRFVMTFTTYLDLL